MTVGMIDSTGSYTAPIMMPSGASVTISASSVADSSESFSITESLLNPIPVVTGATPTQAGSPLSYSVAISGSGFVLGSVPTVAGGRPVKALNVNSLNE